jgi:chromatin structure-remodeling complex subunit RSC9
MKGPNCYASTNFLLIGWYTEERPNNRMLLSLRSGISTEVRWALDRLCRLSNNEKFSLKAYPGLTDALFEWPERFVAGYDSNAAVLDDLFVIPQDYERLRRNALESLFVLRNASVHEANALELATHSHTRPLLAQTLQKIKPSSDPNIEYIIHVIDILHSISAIPAVHSLSSSYNFVPVILDILRQTSHRSLAITCLTTLDIIISSHTNSIQISPDSPALTTALRYLPLFSDKPLLNASLNYIYAHLSYPSMVKSFLLHPNMPGVLRLLVSLLISEQAEETVTHTIGEPVVTVPATVTATKVHEMTEAEFNELLPKPEPQRCYEWCDIFRVCFASCNILRLG